MRTTRMLVFKFVTAGVLSECGAAKTAVLTTDFMNNVLFHLSDCCRLVELVKEGVFWRI